MIRGKTLDAAIFDKAGERALHGPVPIRSFGVAVDFPPCRKCLGRCKVNVTAVSDLPVYVARSVVANQAQRLPASPRQRRTAREVPLVIDVLALVDPVDLSVFGYGVEVPLLVPAGLLQPAGTPDSSPVSRPSRARQAHRSTTAGQSSGRALRPVLPPLGDCLANRACTRLGSDRDDPASPAAGVGAGRDGRIGCGGAKQVVAAVQLRDAARAWILAHCGEPDLANRNPLRILFERRFGTGS